MRESAARSRTTSTFSGVRSDQAGQPGRRTAPAARRRRPARAGAARGASIWLRVPAAGQRVLRGEADQAARVVHLVHHAVAHVHAGGAADALVLQALADVDAGRAHLHAQGAVHARAERQRGEAPPCASARRAVRRGPRRSSRSACPCRTWRSGSARRGTCTCRPARAGSRRCRRWRSRRRTPRTLPTSSCGSAGIPCRARGSA